jgi:hypothetical protein
VEAAGVAYFSSVVVVKADLMNVCEKRGYLKL